MIEYYIAASVGDLESSTREIKRRIINALQDIRGTWSLTDDPHITLQVGRTQNFEDLLRSYKRVACAYQPFKFTVGETQVHEKQGLIEINAPVYSPVLAELQQALLDASSAHLDHIVPRMFRTSDWDDAQAANIHKYHYPYVGHYFQPHVSIGRVPKELLCQLNSIINDWRPAGKYVCGRLDIFTYIQNDPTFAAQKSCSIDLEP